MRKIINVKQCERNLIDSSIATNAFCTTMSINGRRCGNVWNVEKTVELSIMWVFALESMIKKRVKLT